MRAFVHDPLAPRWVRKKLSVGLFLTWLVSTAALAFGSHHLILAVLGVLGWGCSAIGILITPLFERRASLRETTLAIRPGSVDIQEGPYRGFELTPRDVVGASTASFGNEVSLALGLRSGMPPIVLTLASEAEADQVRRALGVGPEGHGTLRWRTALGPVGSTWRVLRIAWRMALFLTIPLAALAPDALAGGLFTATLVTAVVSFALRVIGPVGAPWIELGARGVQFKAPGMLMPESIPYETIQSARAEPGAIVLETARGPVVIPARPAGRFPYGLDDLEKEHIASQIEAAAVRARQPSPLHEAQQRLAVLRRGRERASAWLSRIDAMARAPDGNYRGAPLPEEDALWAVLETPEADPELRLAVARLLLARGGEPVRVRVEEVLAACREPGEEKRIRVALEPDVEEAARELEAMQERA